MKINVKELIHTEFAIKAEKGEILYNELEKWIKKDFDGIEASTTRFFNVSIGKLYKKYSSDIVEGIKIENANLVAKKQMEVSKNGSRAFYQNKGL